MPRISKEDFTRKRGRAKSKMKPSERIKNWKLHPSMRGNFAFELYKAMAENKRVWLLTGDLGYGMFDAIREDFPERFINCGAAEQAMMGIACGLAIEHQIPFVYSITTFLMYRPFETIRTYINHEKLNVKLIGGGRNHDYEHDGISHWSDDVYKLFTDKQRKGILDRIHDHYPQTRDIPGLVKYMVKYEGPEFVSLTR